MKWTKRLRKTQTREDDLRERVDWRALLIIGLIMVAVGVAYAYPRLNPRPRRDFDGRVLEKYVAIGESYTGSTTQPRLVVDTTDGRRLTVAVSDEKYEHAQVGMWLSRRGDKLILSRDEPARGAPDDKGGRMEAR